MQVVRSLLRGRASWLCVLFLIALPLMLFFPVTFGSHTLIPADIPFQYAPFKSAAAALGIAQPHNGLLADLILENYQWKKFILGSLNGGELPLWNPYLFGGVPFLAAGQHSALYPLSLLYYFVPLEKAYGWFTVLNLGLAGVFMFVFARTLGLGRVSSVFAGVVYQLSGFLIASVVFQMIIASVAWLPLILAMCENIIQQKPALGRRPASLPWAFIGAFAIGCHILAGHIEMTVYTALIALLYSAWRLSTGIGFEYIRNDWREMARAAVWLLGMGIAGALLAAVQLLPLFELVTQNFRSDRTEFATVLSYGFKPIGVLRWLMPNFFGSPAHHTFFDAWSFGTKIISGANGNTAWDPYHMKNYVEGAAYVGIITLVFAALAIYAKFKFKKNTSGFGDDVPTGFFITLGIASLLFIFGTPFYAVLYYGLPGINQLHSPFRWVLPLTLCLAMLAGVGMEWAWQQIRRDDGRYHINQAQKPMQRLALGCWLLAGGTVLAVLAVRVGWVLFEPRLAQSVANNQIVSRSFGNAQEFFSYTAAQVLLFTLFAAATGLVLWLASHQPSSSVSGVRAVLAKRWNVLALFLLIGDLTLAWTGFNPAANPALLTHPSSVINFLKSQPNPHAWRITAFTPNGTDDKLLNANLAWQHGLQDIRGYDSIIPKQYMQYMEAIEPQTQKDYNRVAPIKTRAALESPLLDLLNVKYILSEVEIAPPVQGFRQVFADEGVCVYENARAMPKAYTLPLSASLVLTENFAAAIQHTDPRTTLLLENTSSTSIPNLSNPSASIAANITLYKNNEVWVDADVTSASWLVLTDSYFSGWRAFVRPRGADEKAETEVPVVKANGNFRAVQLTQQPSAITVRFKYSPPYFQIGAFVSALTLLALLFLGGFYVYRNAPRNTAGRKSISQNENGSGVKRIAKNSLFLTAFNLSARGIDLIFAAFMARFLGPAGTGQYYFAVIIVSWFEIIMNFGLNTYLTRAVSLDKARGGEYLRQTSLLRLLLGACAVPLLLLVVFGYELRGEMTMQIAIAIGILTVSQLPSSFSTGISALFFAHEKPEIPGALTIVWALLKVAIGATFILLGWGVIGLAITSLIVNLVTLVVLFVLSQKTFGWQSSSKNNPVSIENKKSKILKDSFPLMLNHLLATLFFKVDVPLLKAFKGDVAVGYYSQAYKFVDAFNIIPAFFTQSLFPAMSRQAAQQGNALGRTYVLAVKLLVIIAFPLAVATTFLAEPMIRLLSGNAFLPFSQIALIMMIWSIPIGWINSVTNYALIAAQQQHALTRAFVIGLVFNIIANLLFLPQWSFMAAALITIASEFVEGAAFYLSVRKHIIGVSWLRVLAHPTLAAGSMALVWFACAAAGWFWLGLLMGVGAYVAVLFATRTLDTNERTILAPLLPQRLGWLR